MYKIDESIVETFIAKTLTIDMSVNIRKSGVVIEK